MEFIAALGDNYWQFIAAFVLAFFFFLYGAQTNGQKDGKAPITRKMLIEVAMSAAVVVLIFAFLSGGQGCTVGSGAGDCRPAGQGIYNDC